MRRSCLATCLLLASAFSHAADAPPGGNGAQLALTVTEISILDNVRDPLRYGVEYRFRPIGKWKVRPVAGITTAANGATFVYGDVRRNFRIDEHWSFTPSFGVGRFDPDDVVDLGHPLEFRTGVMMAYHFPARYRLELGVYHFSNGGIGEMNPGTEALVLGFAMPLDGD